MGVQTETWINKSEWSNGPWQDEPDRAEWRVGEFVGLALRHPRHGNWCGYVGVPPGHAWHGKTASWEGENVLPDIDVHGGVTFAGPCMEDDRPQRERVCHVPQPGEADDVWWVGFDCAHAWDRSPGSDAYWRTTGRADLVDHDSTYRSLTYVTAQVESLAEQASGGAQPSQESQ